MANDVWLMTPEIYMEIYELAMKHGKKAGDSMTEEFKEILEKRKGEIKHLGTSDKDVDLVAGNLREEGLKILNLKELERRKKNDTAKGK